MTTETDLKETLAMLEEKLSYYRQQLDGHNPGRQGAIERRLANNPPRYAQRPSLRTLGEHWLARPPETMNAEQKQAVETMTALLNAADPMASPGPHAGESIEEFVARLQMLRAWAGNPTFRELEQRAGTGRLPRSSISDMLRRTSRLPKLDLVAAFVKACGAEAALPAWVAAWYRLNMLEAEARYRRHQAA